MGPIRLTPLPHPLTAAQQSLKTSEQNSKFKWLGKIVVRAGGESLQHIFRPAAGGEHEDWNILSSSSQFPGHRKTILAGKHHVQNDGIELFSLLFVAVFFPQQ